METVDAAIFYEFGLVPNDWDDEQRAEFGSLVWDAYHAGCRGTQATTAFVLKALHKDLDLSCRHSLGLHSSPIRERCWLSY